MGAIFGGNRVLMGTRAIILKRLKAPKRSCACVTPAFVVGIVMHTCSESGTVVAMRYFESNGA
jgi:hypothetical protein